MTRIMVVIGFLVAFAAGLTVGLEVRRPAVARAPAAEPTTHPTTTHPATRGGGRSPGGWFASQLNLTPEQRQQMDAIWSEVARGGRAEIDKRRRQFREERENAILALIGPEGKPKYDAILRHHQSRQRATECAMRSRFEKAVEETNALLTPEQQAKYKALLARQRPPERGERGRGGPDREKPEHQRDDGGAMPKSAPSNVIP